MSMRFDGWVGLSFDWGERERGVFFEFYNTTNEKKKKKKKKKKKAWKQIHEHS